MLPEATLVNNVASVRERIAQAALQVGRDPRDVKLVGISKTHPAELVAAAVRAGVGHLGENRVQEAAAKVPSVAALLGSGHTPTWRLIGHLQTNKARIASDLFQHIDAVDSLRVAEAVSRSRQEREPLPILLEVYVGDDPARPGLRPAELAERAGQIAELPGVQIRGLMTVAPLEGDVHTTRDAFRQIRMLREELAVQYPRVDFRELSMGMSDDFELAVAEGSTLVRIGRALFGAREVR